jgi:hypothetical protein
MGNCTTTSSPEIKVGNNSVAELNNEVKRKAYEADKKAYEAERAVLVSDIELYESALDAFYVTYKDIRINLKNNIEKIKNHINALPNSSDKKKCLLQITFYENELASVDTTILEIHKNLIHSKTQLKILDAQNARRQVIT